MKAKNRILATITTVVLATYISSSNNPAYTSTTNASSESEQRACSINLPRQILRTGINMKSRDLSPNSIQLANQLGIFELLQKIQRLSKTIKQDNAISLENLARRQDLNDVITEVNQIINNTGLEVDCVLGEISAEGDIYNEILNSYTNARDKKVIQINATSYISNGILWAVCAGLSIPTYKYPRLSIPSGINGIVAGVVPSIASIYALKAQNGKRSRSETEPNMLAKIFDYPINSEIDYPDSVWRFLNTAPATEPNSQTRRQQLINRWVQDSNIPAFTDRKSSKQLDVITASISQRRGLSISVLNARQDMLQQLGSEILKMKRLLLELAMAVHGDKDIPQ